MITVNIYLHNKENSIFHSIEWKVLSKSSLSRLVSLPSPFTFIVFVFAVLSSMMTSSNGTFSALLALCAGNSPVTGEFPTQRPVTRNFDVLGLRLNKRLSKQSWGWWFETPSLSLWRHCHAFGSLWYLGGCIHSSCSPMWPLTQFW